MFGNCLNEPRAIIIAAWIAGLLGLLGGLGAVLLSFYLNHPQPTPTPPLTTDIPQNLTETPTNRQRAELLAYTPSA